MMKDGENTPRRRSVLVSLKKEGGAYRLCLDDAKCQDSSSREWLMDVHYTNKLLSSEAFEKLEFDEKELADFGYAILARLHAFNELNEA